MTHTPSLLLGQTSPVDKTETTELVSYEVAQAIPLSQSSQNTAQIGAFIGGSALILGLVSVGALIALLKTCLRICNPNQILIISGRKYKNKNGQSVGYRVVFGGRTLVIPIIERVQSMDMTTMPIPVEVTNAYARGGTPLNIQAIANVKISSNRSIVGNAIERFLGRNRSEIRRVVRETLEGNLRGVVALLTPEQVNEDRLNFAERIAADVAKDLAKLGLHLDTLKIQSVTDDVDYL
ncbi:MAG: SPFH domain-containing protein, partial [Cyanobacteria bacterium P01_F01_bin.3]